jgi:hypothetical protein
LRNIYVAEPDPTAVRSEKPADQIEKRGLTGSIRPDNRDDFARLDSERDVLDGADASKILRYGLRGELRRG